MTFRLILDECREKFGPPPRNPSGSDRDAFRIDVPLARKLSFWMGHPLAGLPKDAPTLIEQGRIVWGYVVAADEALSSASNRQPRTAIVLFGTDSSLDDGAELLERVGDSLAKPPSGTSPVDLSLGKPPLSKPIPADRTEGTALSAGGTLVTPSTLPKGTLERRLLPILIAPERTKQLLILPSRWWSEALLAYWIESPDGAGRS